MDKNGWWESGNCVLSTWFKDDDGGCVCVRARYIYNVLNIGDRAYIDLSEDSVDAVYGQFLPMWSSDQVLLTVTKGC